MNPQINWFFFLLASLSLLGLIVSLILYIANRNRSCSPRILAAIILCLSYTLFAYGLYVSGEFMHFPHLWRTPAFLSLCVAPLTYIYVRSVLDQAFRFRKWDFVFFLPALLYTAQLIPFYLQPASVKLEFIRNAMQSRSYGARELEGVLPPGVGILFRMTYSLGLIIATYVMLFRWQKSDAGRILEIAHNKGIFRWLTYLTIVLSSTYLAMIFSHVVQLSHIFEQYPIASLVNAGTVFFICAYLLFKPDILYGLKGWLPPDPKIDAQDLVSEADEQAERRQTISLDQSEVYRQAIEEHFTTNTPFLKPRYTIRDLSAEIDIPSYLLSAFINQAYGKNFSEFINDYRVAYLEDLVNQQPEFRQFTLEGLGQKGGFRSRSAFIAAVKRKTGKTPSDVFGR
jgi:AraC-like DNA-binding protein